mgnify:CR=1 FL=1
MKNLFYILLILPLFIVSSCEEEEETQNGYNCISSACSAVFENPQYLTLVDCQSACEEEELPVGYICISNNCIGVDENPLYTTLSDCQSACSENIGCIDESACNYNETASVDDGSCIYPAVGYDCNGNIIEYIIGMEVNGGIVFYINETGEHGLVAAKYDIGEYPWGCFETDVVGAVNTLIGAGSGNTLSIIENCLQAPIAASICLDSDSAGYTNWFLPSLDELLLMYNNIGLNSQNTLINNFTPGWHWSSSQANSGYAFAVNFNVSPFGGFTVQLNKYTSYRVRPIRSF